LDQIEEIGIERSLKAAREADLIMVVIDGQHPAISEVARFLSQIDHQKKQVLGVITKKDLLNENERQCVLQLAASLPVSNFTFVSSPNLDGIEEVALEMASMAEEKLARKPGEVVLTQFEHVQAVNRSLECLNQALAAFDLVLFATDVRYGMNELGPLIGETLPDDVLGKIFSDFCIGK
ncbi:MAG: hypothetical protein H7333_07370, partial [Bdellovibrionales bacterium]|nr:hypothetical protein [Oligoflexia bacterium]